MNGETVTDLDMLKRCFCIDELVYSYYNGELEYFLEGAGEHEKAEQLRHISRHNALLLLRLYELLDLPYEETEEEIRLFASER